jgi:hypothetical protein
LFHVVLLPETAPRARLPARVLEREPILDFPTTLIAGLAFLLHFLLIGALYSDWADPVVTDEISIAAVIDAARMPPAPPLESAPAAAATMSSTRGVERTPTAAQPGPSRAAASAAGLSAELEKIMMGILPALGGEEAATSGVLSSSELPTQALDAAAASERGVSGPGTLVLGPSGQPLTPGPAGNLRGIGPTSREYTDVRGQMVAVGGPKATTDISEPTTTGRINDAARVVAGLRPGFRQCYVREIERNADAQGNIRLTLRVGENGEVLSVQAAAGGNLGSAMVACIQARAGAAQFKPPEGGSAAVVVPVIFRNQH